MSVQPLVSEEVLNRVKGWRPYVEAKLGFRNYWYPVLFQGDVKEGQPVEIKLLGESMLINRIDGQLHAIKNQCLHRGVPFSRRLQCLSKGTITCWYHGWTYEWDGGRLCDIITNPQSAQIGKHHLRTYPVREAKGMIFVYVGDAEAHDLRLDVPPGFLDADVAIHGISRVVKSNWRLGAENGFDAGHVYIHKDSVLIRGNDIAMPLGFSPVKPGKSTKAVEDEGGPKGLYDLLGERSIPVFEGTIGGTAVVHGHMGKKRVADNISIWLPGVLKVDPWPEEGLTQFEWYVPIDATTHYYIQTLGKRVTNPEEAAAFQREFEDKWVSLALRGFNDDDVMAREALQTFYEDDSGWIEETLYEPDVAIVEWRRLASKHNRGIQRLEHL
jgi:carbazole 1,9a-dioxygenase terminal dioxygenase component